MKKYYLIFMMPVFLWAQNLNELLDLSLQNRMVNAYQYNLESLQYEYKAQKSAYYPSVDVGASYSETNKETASVPKKGGQAYGKVSLTLFDGGKRENSFSKYRSSIKSSQATLNSVKNQIALDVITYYYDYLSLLAQKETKEKEIEQLTAQQTRLKRFLKVGSTTEDEVQKILSRVESANVNLHEIELQLQTITHNLEYITGQPVSIEAGSSVKPMESTLESLRADIKALEYDLKASKSQTHMEMSEYFPTISVNDTYTYYDLDYQNSAYQRSINEQNVVSLNLTWNIFSFGETMNKTESKYKQYLSLKSQYEYEKNRANVDLQLANKAYEIAKLKIKSAQAGLDAAQSAYEVIKSKFQNGLINNVAYLESLTEKFDAMSVLKEAQYDLEVKKATIIYHSGENLKDYIQ